MSGELGGRVCGLVAGCGSGSSTAASSAASTSAVDSTRGALASKTEKLTGDSGGFYRPHAGRLSGLTE